jgi:hypothetical protein
MLEAMYCRTTEMGHQHDPGAGVQGLADAGQARPDAGVVRYLAVRQRYVQIQAHEHALVA